MTTHKIVCVCEIHQTHAYHIVNPSPWPLSVLLITSGLGILFHFNSTTPLLLGLLTNTLTMYQWWWDIQESAFQRHYTPTVHNGLSVEFLFICSPFQILCKTKTRKAVLSPSLLLLDPSIKKGYSEYVRTKLSRDRQKGCVGYPACKEKTVPLKAQPHTRLC